MKANIALKLTNDAGQTVTLAADVPNWLFDILGGITVDVTVPSSKVLPEVESHVQLPDGSIAVELKEVAAKTKKQAKKAKEAAKAIEAPAPVVEAAVEVPCPECGTGLPVEVIEVPAPVVEVPVEPVVMSEVDQTQIRECILAAIKRTSPATVISCLEQVAGVKRVSEVDPSLFGKVHQAISAL